jgi:thymidylate kinase
VTAGPSNGPIGNLCRELTGTVTGYALACLYAADRYHHVETEIRQHCDAGQLVISDRYLTSGLVMQRFDNIDLGYLWQLNARADQPDLAVILQADPEVIAQRLAERKSSGRENRRVLYDPYEVEIAHKCISSVQEIRFHLQEVIGDFDTAELRNPLRGIQASCRQFLTDIQAIEGRWSQVDIQRGGTASWLFNQALGELRACVGDNVAIIVETLRHLEHKSSPTTLEAAGLVVKFREGYHSDDRGGHRVSRSSRLTALKLIE